MQTTNSRLYEHAHFPKSTKISYREKNNFTVYGLFNKSVTNLLILYWPCIDSWSAALALGPPGPKANTTNLKSIHARVNTESAS